MNDQTAKADAGKARISLVPTAIIYAIAKVREYGCNRYPEGGKDNWKRVEAERYRDALGRHFLAYIDEPYGVDRESGLPHLWHLATNCAFLCELDGEAIKQIDAEKTAGDLENQFEEKDISCTECKHFDKDENEYPCTSCNRNYVSMFERKE